MDGLASFVTWVILSLLTITIVASISVNSHGAGEMDAYITQVSRIGDRVSIKVKDSVDSSNTYSGCISSSDEQIFKDAIGKKVRLSWDGVFSIAPFWIECPGPVRIMEAK